MLEQPQKTNQPPVLSSSTSARSTSLASSFSTGATGKETQSKRGEVSDQFTDVATALPFKDAVVIADEHTFDRQTVVTWWKIKPQTSPLTRLSLSSADMIPNLAMQCLVRWIAEYQKNDAAFNSAFDATIKTTLANLQAVARGEVVNGPIWLLPFCPLTGSDFSVAQPSALRERPSRQTIQEHYPRISQVSGVTYQEKSLYDYIDRHGCDPLTGDPLSRKKIVGNFDMRLAFFYLQPEMRILIEEGKKRCSNEMRELQEAVDTLATHISPAKVERKRAELRAKRRKACILGGITGPLSVIVLGYGFHALRAIVLSRDNLEYYLHQPRPNWFMSLCTAGILWIEDWWTGVRQIELACSAQISASPRERLEECNSYVDFVLKHGREVPLGLFLNQAMEADSPATKAIQARELDFRQYLLARSNKEKLLWIAVQNDKIEVAEVLLAAAESIPEELLGRVTSYQMLRLLLNAEKNSDGRLRIASAEKEAYLAYSVLNGLWDSVELLLKAQVRLKENEVLANVQSPEMMELILAKTTDWSDQAVKMEITRRLFIVSISSDQSLADNQRAMADRLLAYLVNRGRFPTIGEIFYENWNPYSSHYSSIWSSLLNAGYPLNLDSALQYRFPGDSLLRAVKGAYQMPEWRDARGISAREIGMQNALALSVAFNMQEPATYLLEVRHTQLSPGHLLSIFNYRHISVVGDLSLLERAVENTKGWLELSNPAWQKFIMDAISFRAFGLLTAVMRKMRNATKAVIPSIPNNVMQNLLDEIVKKNNWKLYDSLIHPLAGDLKEILGSSDPTYFRYIELALKNQGIEMLQRLMDVYEDPKKLYGYVHQRPHGLRGILEHYLVGPNPKMTPVSLYPEKVLKLFIDRKERVSIDMLTTYFHWDTEGQFFTKKVMSPSLLDCACNRWNLNERQKLDIVHLLLEHGVRPEKGLLKASYSPALIQLFMQYRENFDQNTLRQLLTDVQRELDLLDRAMKSVQSGNMANVLRQQQHLQQIKGYVETALQKNEKEQHERQSKHPEKSGPCPQEVSTNDTVGEGGSTFVSRLANSRIITWLCDCLTRGAHAIESISPQSEESRRVDATIRHCFFATEVEKTFCCRAEQPLITDRQGSRVIYHSPSLRY